MEPHSESTNTVSLELGWRKALWAVQPQGTDNVLFGEVDFAGSVKEAVAQAAREARRALAADSLEGLLEAVVAFDGSLLWPALHRSAAHVLLAVSKDGIEKSDLYRDEAAGNLVRSLFNNDQVVAVDGGEGRAVVLVELVERAQALRPRVIALALEGSAQRPGAEHEAELALRDKVRGVPVLLSSEVTPLWGWGDRPVEKTAVSAAMLPIVEEAAQGAREGLADEGVPIWFASLDGTLIPASLARRHPYAVMRGLPILSLSGAIAYARAVPGEGAAAAASIHETSTAVARLAARPSGATLSAAILGAHIESEGIGAEGAVWADRGTIRVAEERAPASSTTVRAVLAAAGLVPQGAQEANRAMASLSKGFGETREAAIGLAFSAVNAAFAQRLRRHLDGCPTVLFCGVLAGALAALAGTGAGAKTVFVPPAFGASAALAAHRAPRASRSASVLAPSVEPRSLEEVARLLEEEIALAVEHLENNGVDRTTLAAVAWLEGADAAHGVYPVLERAAIRKAAEGLAKDAPPGASAVLSVEVYPAKTGEREEVPPRMLSPLSAPATRRIILPGESAARELRVVPAGALTEESPTRGPALLSDPTGLILVPEGFVAHPAPLGGAQLRRV